MSQEKDFTPEEEINNDEIVNEETFENNDNLSDMNEETTDWKAKYEELNNSYLRLHAEFDNYRKRTLKEKTELLKTAGERIMVDILPVVDDFERALENIEKSNDIDAVKNGIELIYNKFIDFLLKNGVKKMDVIGQPFDMDKHEALTTVPADSNEKKDKVVDVIQQGYELGDKVIRYPKVIVAK